MFISIALGIQRDDNPQKMGRMICDNAFITVLEKSPKYFWVACQSLLQQNLYADMEVTERTALAIMFDLTHFT